MPGRISRRSARRSTRAASARQARLPRSRKPRPRSAGRNAHRGRGDRRASRRLRKSRRHDAERRRCSQHSKPAESIGPPSPAPPSLAAWSACSANPSQDDDSRPSARSRRKFSPNWAFRPPPSRKRTRRTALSLPSSPPSRSNLDGWRKQFSHRRLFRTCRFYGRNVRRLMHRLPTSDAICRSGCAEACK